MKLFSKNNLWKALLFLLGVLLTKLIERMLLSPFLLCRLEKIITYKTLFLMVLLLIFTLISWLLYETVFNKTIKNNKTGHVKISHKQINLLKSLTLPEKNKLNQFFEQNKSSLNFEDDISIQLLCDKNILYPIGVGISIRNGPTLSAYSVTEWALNYLTKHRELLT